MTDEHLLTHVPLSDGTLTPACTCGWYSPDRSHWRFERHLARLRGGGEDNVTGAELIAAERQRQIDIEGWTSEHDVSHNSGELLLASACYLDHAAVKQAGCYPLAAYKWPWDESWWKPSDDPIRDLVKAGALIAAEIDRLSRDLES